MTPSVCAQPYLRSVAINGDISVSVWAGLILSQSDWLPVLSAVKQAFSLATVVILFLHITLSCNSLPISGLLGNQSMVCLQCCWCACTVYLSRFQANRYPSFQLKGSTPVLYTHYAHEEGVEGGCDWVPRVRRTEVGGGRTISISGVHIIPNRIQQTVSIARWKLVFDCELQYRSMVWDWLRSNVWSGMRHQRNVLYACKLGYMA